ncbi:hypothetical protein [Mycoplasmopsis arginini]|uniref:Lipoprotein n=1 Tax=Mycoplasmopsis arginini TaxID=2094 RepID=A0AA43QZL8_MYCAR|nr:hypothetical protein [Mycoplasmopsis arginini]MDI3349440.1 hypothetical protein [Mycoplasmopsis arginini]
MTRLNKILFILGGLSAAALPVTAIACNDTQKPTPTPPTPPTPQPQSQPENPGAGTEEGGADSPWISDYNAKVKEAEELLTQLKKDSSKYSTIISHLEEELAAAKAAVSLQNSGKEEYQIATKGLTEEIAKATEVKKDIDSGQ